MIETSVAAALARLNGLSGSSVSRDLPKKVEWIHKELGSIQCLLEDAASKSANGDEEAKQWVKELKEACYQIEDMVDDVEQVEEAQRRREGNFFKKFVDMPGEMMVVREILSRADGIISAIKDISEAGKRYDSDSKPLEEVKSEDNNGSFVEPCFGDETKMIGFESEFQQVMGLLTDQEKKDRTFIALVGMDGIGKTTLAKKVYDSRGISECFEISAWAVAPHKCETADVLKSVLKGLLGVSQKSYNNTSEITASNIEKMKEKEMVEKIQELLKSRKYLIVLDDISSRETWNRIQQILPNSGNGSRIVVTTTQNLEMVKPEGEEPFLHAIELPLLSDEDSWEVLKSNVFRVSSGDSDDTQLMIEELEPIGRSLVSSCRGFPLALVLLSGLLAKNLSYKSWSDIADAIIRREPTLSDRKFCENVLSLHQNYLPNTFVRSCLHYISSYPKNFPFSTSKLFKLWIAEGLVPYNKDRSFEQTAHEYLITLIERRMLQVVQKSGLTGRVKKVRMHSILHAWCADQAQKTGFFAILESSTETEGNNNNNNNNNNVPVNSSSVFVSNAQLDNTFVESLYNPRSIVSSGLEVHELKQQSCNKLNSLRVFDLDDSHLKNWKKLEEAFLKMRHLRYLGLRKANIWGDASFTKNLMQLQTFDARGPFITNVVPEFWNIQTLRNVYMSGNIVPTVTPYVTKSLHKLHLELHIPSTYNWRPMTQLLEKQTDLVFLTFRIKGHGTIPVTIFAPFKNRGNLQYLKLDGKLNPPQLPSELPTTLVELTLIKTHLKKDPMPVLELLPNLSLLRLEYGSYKGSADLYCSAGGFAKLEELKLDGSCRVQGWKAEEGAMPCLTNLLIMAYDFMEKLPEALAQLTNLKELHVIVYEEDSAWLATRLNQESGEDWGKIKHVPHIGVHPLPNLYFTEKPNRTFSTANSYIRHLSM